MCLPQLLRRVVIVTVGEDNRTRGNISLAYLIGLEGAVLKYHKHAIEPLSLYNGDNMY